QTPAREVIRELRSCRGGRLQESDRRALGCFNELRTRLLDLPTGSPRGVRGGFFASIDPLLRARLRALYAEHFEEESVERYDQLLVRQDRLVDWLTCPLQARPAA